MKKHIVFALIGVVSLAMALPVFAVPNGMSVELAAKGAGKVVFFGRIHDEKGIKCADCHQTRLFKMEKGADAITMKDINEGKFCGACHNGTKAFSAKDAANCSKCHKK